MPGGTYFFTVNLADRRRTLLVEHIDHLRETVRKVKQTHPFDIVAWVVLPDHMHAIWRLPEGDADCATRWALIKAGFSRGIPKEEKIHASKQSKRERGIWQRRYWEHVIRDDRDYEAHVNYCYINPVKHGWVERVCDWPFSTFHRDVEAGIYTANWAGTVSDLSVGEAE
jgi:putative transposase